jgi:hypothetical protein
MEPVVRGGWGASENLPCTTARRAFDGTTAETVRG